MSNKEVQKNGDDVEESVDKKERLTIDEALANLIDSFSLLIFILILGVVADIILAILGVSIGITDALSGIYGWFVFLVLGYLTIQLIDKHMKAENKK